MDFDLDPDQALLQDSVARLVRERYGFDARLAYLAEPGGWSRAMWRQYAAMGLLGLPFNERHGGSGRGPVESMIVMEAFGRGLVLEPYLATVVLAGGALQLGGSASQQQAHLPAIAAGERLMALAYTERDARYDLTRIAARARPVGTGWVLDGEKTLVLHGDCADVLVVAARFAGEPGDPHGVALFLVDGDAPGVARRPHALQSDTRAADVTLAGVRVGGQAVLGEPATGLALLERVIDRGIAALCAEGVGVLQEMHAMTVDYLKTRRQFGVPIGSFQALQHRAVDMLVALEQARSMSLLATMMAGDDDPLERRKAVAAAKVQFGRSARSIGQDAIQLHGGIGMTLDCRVGHCVKRATTLEFLFGDAEHHLAVLARLGGFTAPPAAPVAAPA